MLDDDSVTWRHVQRACVCAVSTASGHWYYADGLWTAVIEYDLPVYLVNAQCTLVSCVESVRGAWC